MRSTFKKLIRTTARNILLTWSDISVRINARRITRHLLSQPVKSNDTLRTLKQRESTISLLKSLNLRLHPDPPKNWDAMASLITILKNTSRDSCILDAGGEYYSSILPMLRSLGYKDLFAVNLTFNMPAIRKNGILFEKGDITQTRFQDNTFDAIACLSVIEHGVDIERYFEEMSRILKPGGILFTSADYWIDPVNTGDQIAFGVPIKIFSKAEMLRCMEIASRKGLTLTGDLDLRCEEKVVHWHQFNLSYTFTYFTLRKTGR